VRGAWSVKSENSANPAYTGVRQPGSTTFTVSIQQANPKGFLETILAQIKLFWLKLCHPEAEIVKPLGFLTRLLNSYVIPK
jgi:hypothetical protein